jgi:hypothetical protein
MQPFQGRDTGLCADANKHGYGNAYAYCIFNAYSNHCADCNQDTDDNTHTDSNSAAKLQQYNDNKQADKRG